MKAKSGIAENILRSAIDQDGAAAVDLYDRLSPTERQVLVHFLARENGDLQDASKSVVKAIVFFAALGFEETAQRWMSRNEEHPS